MPACERVPLRTHLLRIAAMALAVAVALALGEAALRVTGYVPSYYNPLSSFHEGDDLIGYRGKPLFEGRYRTPQFDVGVAHDERGFRRQEHRREREDARYAIYALGDSFTWGSGVDQGEVFTDRMSAGHPDVYVDNLGLNASGTVAQHRLFEVFVEPRLVAGDVVLLMFFHNDFSDNLLGALRAEVRDDGSVAPVKSVRRLGGGVKSTIKDWSYLANLVFFLADNMKARRAMHRARERAPAIERLGADSDEFRVLVHYLGKLERACAAKGARFVVVCIPGQRVLDEATHEDPVADRNEELWRSAVLAATRAAAVETLDLLPPFLERKRQAPHERLSLAGDEHWSAAGHRAAADVIMAWLEDAP